VEHWNLTSTDVHWHNLPASLCSISPVHSKGYASKRKHDASRVTQLCIVSTCFQITGNLSLYYFHAVNSCSLFSYSRLVKLSSIGYSCSLVNGQIYKPLRSIFIQVRVLHFLTVCINRKTALHMINQSVSRLTCREVICCCCCASAWFISLYCSVVRRRSSLN